MSPGMSASTNSWSLEAHDTEVRLERRERVVGDLRLRRAHRRDQRRLPRVREADERGVGEQLQLELQPALLAVLALFGEARRRGARSTGSARCRVRPARRAPRATCRRACTRSASSSPSRAVHDRSFGNVDDEIGAALAVQLLARCRACPSPPCGADDRGTRAATRRCGSRAARRRRRGRRRRRRARPAGRGPRAGTRHSPRRRRRPSRCIARHRRSRTSDDRIRSRTDRGASAGSPCRRVMRRPSCRLAVVQQRAQEFHAPATTTTTSASSTSTHRPRRPPPSSTDDRADDDGRRDDRHGLVDSTSVEIAASPTGANRRVCNAPTQVELHVGRHTRRNDGRRCRSTADRCSRRTPSGKQRRAASRWRATASAHTYKLSALRAASTASDGHRKSLTRRTQPTRAAIFGGLLRGLRCGRAGLLRGLHRALLLADLGDAFEGVDVGDRRPVGRDRLPSPADARRAACRAARRRSAPCPCRSRATRRTRAKQLVAGRRVRPDRSRRARRSARRGTRHRSCVRLAIEPG